MIKAVVTDFSKVLLFAKDAKYQGGLNALNARMLSGDPVYPFFDYFELNDDLLEYYQKLKTRVPVYVFTTESIQDHPAIKAHVRSAVTGVMSAKELNLSKEDSKSYKAIASQIRCRPDEVLYIDDKEANLEAAASTGFETLLYTGNDQVTSRIDKLLTPGS